MSNCVCNFNILALVVFELLGGSQIYVRGSVPPVRPYGKHFCARGEYFTMPNGIFNFNFLALVFSEILGGSQIYTRWPFNFNILSLVVSEILWGPIFKLGGAVPPVRPIAEFFLYPRRVRYYV